MSRHASDEGLVHAFLLDGKGGGTPMDWAQVEAWRPEQGLMWVHLDRTDERAKTWLTEKSGLSPVVAQVLLDEESRPRTFHMEGGALVILRGVNLNPGADPEDMISLRCWFKDNLVVTTRRYMVMAVADIREALKAGRGPERKSTLLAELATGLTKRMEPVLEALEARVDGFEDRIIDSEASIDRGDLRSARYEAIVLRRYLAPQRETLNRLSTEDFAWISPHARAKLREAADRTLRYVEDLDAQRERTTVIQDELMNQMSERMNRTMYLLTIVAALMMPLGVVTGLLGVNVGGIPGGDNPWAFAILCVILGLLVALQIWFFKRKKWF